MITFTGVFRLLFVSTPDQIIKKWGKSDEDIAKYGDYDFIDWNYNENNLKMQTLTCNIMLMQPLYIGKHQFLLIFQAFSII